MPQHLIVLMGNLYCGWEAIVRTECGETEGSHRTSVSDKGTFYLPMCLICTQNMSHKKLS